MLFRYFVEIYFDSCFSALLKCYRDGENAVLTLECLAFSGGNAYAAVFTLVLGVRVSSVPSSLISQKPSLHMEYFPANWAQ